jgi:hypothetical protein
MTSCAPTLPKETVNLSVLLEQQIDALEKTQISIIDAYFNEKKRQAREIVDNEAYPMWQDDFFAKDEIKKEWRKAIAKDTGAQSMESLSDILGFVHKEYNAILRLATEPLEKQHDETLALIREEYQKARNMIRTIRENISSVRDVQEARERLMPKEIKNAENIFNQYLQEADAIINKARDTQTHIGTPKGKGD